ncbi:hypothetical protein A3A63_02335 [Candidatus Gottesmanbacteria bacterium RIFCSPLOWO2_01_FULL_46_9]|uniref:Glycosyltransferase RgtA/B/C/D-like domain-containing protein n=1 Tax=Candidatus Gottesmanbacteria bacterium RIFCSPLOWO2_01_FULL_46_9 TaxID=1798394 RepID=A0A1F6B281_9BACT|nr:MAG: hypothetical protein A3A63_02335 [Candidatus Gottesmanbacteria bacterium RIFCSPLOWO2_01_FULL_46_9]
MKRRIAWCKENILYGITLFLLAFIPLYPKLPLINVIRTWVYIRLEDFLIAIASMLLLWMFVRQKRLSSSPLSVPIVFYWIVGSISLVNALIFIFPHLTGVYAHLGLLHFARRIEYMLLYFLAYEAFKKKPVFLPFLWTLIGSYFFIILYGFGQKFFGFPAFLTMNEEFAKGVPLRLPPTARFPSTFGGHYDLAAYLVLTIPIMGSFMVGSKKLWQTTAYFFLTVLGLIMLLFTASRVSFGVYLIVMSVMLLWQKRAILIVPTIVLSIVILNLTSGASERFYKTFRVNDVVIDLSTGKAIGTLDSLEKNSALLEKGKSPAEESLPKGSEYINLSGGSVNQVKTVQFLSKNVAGAEGELATVSGSFLIQKALVYDISITTRLQAEWPMAIKAFQRNLALGSGYSSLSVATDGEYFRMLGETGILGFIAFLGIFAVSFLLFHTRKDTLVPIERSFVIGLYSGVVGLMVNAVLIDVFEASKVAYTLWLLLGIATAIQVAKKPLSIEYFRYLWKLATSNIALVIYLLIAISFIWSKTFTLYFLGDDFTWLRWAAESKVGDLVGYFSHSQGFFYRPIPKLWYFLLFSVFWLKPLAYHGMSIILLSAAVLLLYRLMMRLGISRPFAWFGALFFSALSIHHENIYWISGQSSLLSGFFLLSAIVLLMETNARERWKPLVFAASCVTLLFSMLSYDGMLVAPVIMWLIGMATFKHKRWVWFYLLLLPLYVWMRISAGALAPQGDYGYKMATFLVNSAGNTIGYSLSILLGPSMIDGWNLIRSSMSPFIKEVTAAVVLFLGFAAWALWSVRSRFQVRTCTVCVWPLCFVISLLAYVPLGGMAERYVYIPSMFFIIGSIAALQALWRSGKRFWLKVVVFAAVAIILVYNINDAGRVGADWEKASTVADQALRVVKKEAFPPQNILHFYVVNTPIRYGRAWIFPTGLNDALWHIYRQSPYFITPVGSIEEGYRIPLAGGDRRVFIFEDYVLKRGIEETRIVPPVPTDEKKRP